MFHTRRRFLSLAAAGLVVVRSATSPAWAAGRCCAGCRGQRHACTKVCRLVREEKQVEVVCWGWACEDFCIPPPSRSGCRHCETVCDECAAGDPAQPHAKAKKSTWTDWIPGCATRLNTKNKLMKKVVTKKVPSFRWEVEDLCPACERRCVGAAVYPDEQLPAAPIEGAVLKFVRLDTPPSEES